MASQLAIIRQSNYREKKKILDKKTGISSKTMFPPHKEELAKSLAIIVSREVTDELVLQIHQEIAKQISELHNQLTEKQAELQSVEPQEELSQLRFASKQRALELRKKLGLGEINQSQDGFEKLNGLLKDYAKPNETPEEFLHSTREEEKE
jgi:hypothetical protein